MNENVIFLPEVFQAFAMVADISDVFKIYSSIPANRRDLVFVKSVVDTLSLANDLPKASSMADLIVLHRIASPAERGKLCISRLSQLKLAVEYQSVRLVKLLCEDSIPYNTRRDNPDLFILAGKLGNEDIVNILRDTFGRIVAVDYYYFLGRVWLGKATSIDLEGRMDSEATAQIAYYSGKGGNRAIMDELRYPMGAIIEDITRGACEEGLEDFLLELPGVDWVFVAKCSFKSGNLSLLILAEKMDPRVTKLYTPKSSIFSMIGAGGNMDMLKRVVGGRSLSVEDKLKTLTAASGNGNVDMTMQLIEEWSSSVAFNGACSGNHVEMAIAIRNEFDLSMGVLREAMEISVKNGKMCSIMWLDSLEGLPTIMFYTSLSRGTPKTNAWVQRRIKEMRNEPFLP